jgi:hypothetical protein
MQTFWIRYGLGGCGDWEEVDCATEDAAWELARENAIQSYESYAGLHGLRTEEEIMEEENCDADEAADIYGEEVESWLEYEVATERPEDYS